MRRIARFGGGLTLALVAVGAGSAAGQGLPPAPEAMKELDFIVGDWAGSGWIEYMPGQRGEFTGTERVERRMGGRLVVVEGSHTAWMGPQRGDVPVHQAVGVFSYDARAGEFTFRTWTARGGHGGRNYAEVGDGTIVWGYDDPNFGTVRYTITLTPDGKWHEVGRATKDGGATWRQFFEMTFERTATTARPD